jgi:hypothetical protein
MKNIFSNVCIVLAFIGLMCITYDMMKFQFHTTKKYTDNMSVIRQYAEAIQIYKSSPLDIQDFSQKIKELSTIDPADYKYTFTK